jgi:large subunit ribosomal protein L24
MRRRVEKVRHRVSIRKGDIVRVTAGRDKGKSGRVLSVDAVKMRCTVEHVNMVKRHTRPNPQKNIKGGIAEREGPIHVSNVMIVSPASNKPVRVGHQILPDGTKVRVGRQCGSTLDK